MFRSIQKCVLIALGAAVLSSAADRGSIVVNQTLLRLDAIAGEENCTFLAPIEQNILVACFVEDQIVQIHAYRPKPGGAAITGDFIDANNNIRWSLSETADGKFRWEIHANDTVQSGQF